MKDTTISQEVVTELNKTVFLEQKFIDLVASLNTGHIARDIRARYSASSVIQLLVWLKLMGVMSINQVRGLGLNKCIPFGKDVMYKIKNSSLVNWRRLQLRSFKACLEGVTLEDPEVSDPWNRPCLILDDTDIVKRGKCMEFIGNIFSHVTGRYSLGFKALHLAYWSGKHMLHVDFSVHIEVGKKGNQGLSKKEQKQRYSIERPKGSHVKTRSNEIHKSKIDMAINMVRRALKTKVNVSYVLADSWFFSSKLLAACLKANVHLISRPKNNAWKYEHDGKLYTLTKLREKIARKHKKVLSPTLNQYHLSCYAQFKGHRIRIYFYKEKRRGSKWYALVSTDRSLTPVQAWKVYKNRWAIEVSFKELKQHLRYGKCQSQNFNAQIADIAMSLMAYNTLSHHKAVCEYETIGGLFSEVSHAWVKPDLMTRYWQQFHKVLTDVAEAIGASVKFLLQILDDNQFVQNLLFLSQNLTTET